jgi:hypothetical protein
LEHHFNIEIAKKYDVNIAIFLNNVAYWVQKNQANKKHFHGERYWTYNSSEALSVLFPYWSTDQIDRLIKKCIALGLLLVDRFNETPYDRTRWFSLTDLSLEMFNIAIPRNSGMYSDKSRNEDRGIAEPIPDNKPDIKKIILRTLHHLAMMRIVLNNFGTFIQIRRKRKKRVRFGRKINSMKNQSLFAND